MKTNAQVRVSVEESMATAMKRHPDLRASPGDLVVLQAPKVAPPAPIDKAKLGVQPNVPRGPRGPKA